MIRIVWDWNGTLLDDVDLCFDCLNDLLKDHGLAPLKDIQAYRQVFGFPIQDYYQKVGFDFHKTPYDVLANEYMDNYQERSYACSLFKDVRETLHAVKELGISQSILSASKKDYLLKQIALYDIDYFLDSIWGIDDIYAHSKEAIAKHFYQTCDPKDEIWFVGDSIHDYEVANSIDAKCILVTTGHQSRCRLEQTGVPVVDTMKESLRVIYEGSNHSRK